MDFLYLFVRFDFFLLVNLVNASVQEDILRFLKKKKETCYERTRFTNAQLSLFLNFIFDLYINFGFLVSLYSFIILSIIHDTLKPIS